MIKRWFKFLFICALLLVLDCSLKYYTHTAITPMNWLHPFYPYGGIGVFENFYGISFSINHVENAGAAWGYFSQYTNYLIVLRAVIIIALLGYVLLFNKEKNKTFLYLLIITGALGNMLDFFFYGKVIDMFHFTFGKYSYPVFNLADCMICFGIIFLLVMPILPKKWKTKFA